jgi:hypothetical protein
MSGPVKEGKSGCKAMRTQEYIRNDNPAGMGGHSGPQHIPGGDSFG